MDSAVTYLDESVQELEQIANQGSTHEKFVFDLGVRHGRQLAISEMSEDFREKLSKTQEAAIAFQKLVSAKISDFESFRDLRAGYQMAEGYQVLALLPEVWTPRLSEFRQYARNVETFYWEKHEIEISILTMASDSPDKEKISRAFPTYFSPENA